MNRTLRLLLPAVILLITGMSTLKAQLAFSPFIDSLIRQADHNSVLLLTRQLAGDTTVVINGETVTISSRHYNNQGNARAAAFIFDKFTEYGYTPEKHLFSNGRGENVIATKTGIKHPEKEFIICGHYDNMPSGSNSPGADDNASGTVAVLEAARLLAPFDFDYTIRFAAWDEEEIGLVGSYAYAQRAKNQGQQILGVLNLDMIAWDSNNDNTYSIATNTLSQSFTNDFIRTSAYYTPQLNHNFYYTTASDHASFWQFGYPAMLAIEDWYDFNAYYHTPGDDIDILNMPYYVTFVQASIANIAAQAWDQRFILTHDPVLPGNSTEPREAELLVSGPQKPDTGNYPPRLWYSVNEGAFDFVLPYAAEGSAYKFQIPGAAFGSEVRYYFAIQDSAGRFIATLPSGGRGINPPGSIAPGVFYHYSIDDVLFVNTCSPNTPLALGDAQNTYDEIVVEELGSILDVNVNIDITHTRTGDLRLILTSPDGTATLLANMIGGDGDNFTNTLFDDQAELNITESTPPYTGRFRPQMALSAYNGKESNGTWTMRVYDGQPGNTGTLNSWCLQILYHDPSTSVNDPEGPDASGLAQNYPNPADHSTTIGFTLNAPSEVSLKVYNTMGQEVAELASGRFTAGKHLIVAGLRQLTPGTYFYRLETGRFSQTKQMVIIR
jgi:subtilisin-like proprotein convertase family protein